VETRRRAVDLPSSQCSNSFAPTGRVTAEFDSQRLARTARSCDYKNKKRQHAVSAAGIPGFSLLFVKSCLFHTLRA
jgi:hypothetical protein